MPASLRVDFYLLPSAEPLARLRFACRLTEKAYKLENRVHLHTIDASEAALLDDLLWTFRQGSFVPHEVVGNTAPAGTDPMSPVTIGYGDRRAGSAELLIDLVGGEPGHHAGFARIAEIVDGLEKSRDAARARFRGYQESGVEPVTHTIEAS